MQTDNFDKVDSVENFKACAKELIQKCLFKEAIELCNAKYGSEVFKDI